MVEKFPGSRELQMNALELLTTFFFNGHTLTNSHQEQEVDENKVHSFHKIEQKHQLLNSGVESVESGWDTLKTIRDLAFVFKAP